MDKHPPTHQPTHEPTHPPTHATHLNTCGEEETYVPTAGALAQRVLMVLASAVAENSDLRGIHRDLLNVQWTKQPPTPRATPARPPPIRTDTRDGRNSAEEAPPVHVWYGIYIAWWWWWWW